MPPDPWTVETLRVFMQERYGDLRILLDERYQTQTKALEAAFTAQQTAMHAALQSAEKAVEAALRSSEKAVAKAEVAAEKRFESVNEFRAQLADQAQTFVSRGELDIRIAALSERVDELNTKASLLASRMDSAQGSMQGSRVTVGNMYMIIIAFAAIAGIIGFTFSR
jgi:small-conductance mechanosensitive channel